MRCVPLGGLQPVVGVSQLCMQVGSFYEAAGLDAILLVEHCGLNFMGGNLSAGCPVGNIHQVLKQLVREAGFDVVSGECCRPHAGILVGT